MEKKMSVFFHALAPLDPTSKTGQVWQLADEITHKKGRMAERGEVIDAYVAQGGNPNTASTQFSHWKKAYLDSLQQSEASVKSAPAGPRSTAPAQLVIGADGRVVIPAEMRAAMQIGTDGKVTARVTDGELHVIAPQIAIRRVQEMVRNTIPAGVSLADELIAERRAEVHMEDAK